VTYKFECPKLSESLGRVRAFISDKSRRATAPSDASPVFRAWLEHEGPEQET